MNYKRILKNSMISSLVLTMVCPTVGLFAQEKVKENIALNKPVVSSTIENNYRAENAVDGNINTYWAAKNPSELEVDLQGYYKISGINMLAYFTSPAVNRYYDYEIYASVDHEKYDLIAKETETSWNTPEGDNFEFDENFTARYIKVKITKTHAENQPENNTGHIQELRVYGELDPDYQQPTIKTNVALNKPALASGQEGGSAPSKAVDGNVGSY